MKYALIATLMLFSAFACAQGNSKNGLVTDSTSYTYSQHLDVAKVISIHHDAPTAAGCNPVGTHMTYLDSKGNAHVLNYQELSPTDTTCQNG